MQAGGLGWMKMYTHYQIKQSIRETIASGTQVNIGETFVFNGSEAAINDPAFSWEEAGAEFLYKGNWYDVISIRQEKNKCIIQAVKDGQDTQLAATWNNLHQNNNASSPLHNGTLAKFFAAFDPQVQSIETIAPPAFATIHRLQHRFQISTMPVRSIDQPPCLL